jgi:NAD(P)-dependent dehydrogenase (short-subunit alcohol dehydrogenase family)
VRDDAAVEALAARVEKLDVVIHCAGRVAPVEEYKPEVFKKTFWTFIWSINCARIFLAFA